MQFMVRYTSKILQSFIHGTIAEVPVMGFYFHVNSRDRNLVNSKPCVNVHTWVKLAFPVETSESNSCR